MKKIILAIIIILMTGCSVNYNIVIDKDFKIVEKVVIEEDADFYINYYHTMPVNVMNGILDNYKDILNEKKYQYYVDENNGNPLIVLEKTYDNYDDYINNTILLNDYFEKVNFVKKDNVLKISTEGFNPNDSDNPDRFYIKKLDIGITSAYKVNDNNAIKYDKEDNTYYYSITSDTENMSLLMDIDTSKRFNPLEEYYGAFIVAIMIVIASWIFVFVKKKKKNK